MLTNTDNLSPQHIVFQTIKKLILNLHELIKELKLKHEGLEKNLDEKFKNVSDFNVQLDLKIKELTKSIDDVEEEMEEMNVRIKDLEDYVKEQKMHISFGMKFMKFASDVPKVLLTLGSLLAALFTYFYTHLH